MTHSVPNHGTSYPLRIGRTLQKGCTPRSIISLKFPHIPNNMESTRSGCIKRNDEKCTVSLSTDDGNNLMFNGSRRANSALSDYVLVYANGEMWLERVDDAYPSMKLTSGGPMDTPMSVDDNIRGDPDSWMMEESGSPVTQESNEGEHVRPQSTTGGKSVASKTVAYPGLPNDSTVQSSSEEDDSDDSDSDSSDQYTDRSSDEED